MGSQVLEAREGGVALVFTLVMIGCGGTKEARSPDGDQLERDCTHQGSADSCAEFERVANIELGDCERRGGSSCATERARFKRAKRTSSERRASGEQPAAAPPEAPARDAGEVARASPPQPPDDATVADAAVVALREARCGVGRRAFLEAAIAVRTDGAVARVDTKRSTLLTREQVSCAEGALRAMHFGAFVMPKGKGVEVECPPGADRAPLLQFKCREGQTDVLRFRPLLVVEDDGVVTALPKIPQQPVGRVLLGKVGEIIGRDGVKGFVVPPQEWSRAPGGARQYCIEATPNDLRGAAAGQTVPGWCFPVSCNAAATGQLGLAEPTGEPVCPNR